MRNSLAIKNLCFALEALSRIPDSYEFSQRIQSLLKAQLKEEEELPPFIKQTEPNLDDEIPF